MFRGIDIKTGEWVEGYYKYHPYYDIHLICVYEKKFNILQPPDGIWAEHEVHPDSIAMDTGQVDKNKKPIYGSILIDGKMTKGGDICKWTAYGYPSDYYEDLQLTLKHAVKWDTGGFDIPYIDETERIYEIIGTQWDKEKN